MSLGIRTLRRYYGKCDPLESLDPSDERNLDLDSFGPVSVRGIRWVDRLASKFERSPRPVMVLFTGLPGSGKSTEIRRLMGRLADPDGAHLLPVYVDAEVLLDIHNPIDVPDILIAIILQTERDVLTKEGKDPDGAAHDGFTTRVLQFLKNTLVEPEKLTFGLPAGVKLDVKLKTEPTFRERVRSVLATHLSEFLRQAREAMLGLEGRARSLGYAGLFIVVDSLEKLRGISTNWESVIQSAERVFSGGAPYLRLPVHVLYTVPPALIARRVEDVLFLPMIKLYSKEGELYPEGIEVVRELVRRRIPDDGLAELLGPDAEQRVERLIQWSGGYPRDLIRMLRAILEMSDYPLSETEFARVGAELEDAYRKVVSADAFDWLAQVHINRYVTADEAQHRSFVDSMLTNSAVLRYLNQQDWFDLHPAVLQIPGVQEALRKAGGSAAELQTE